MLSFFSIIFSYKNFTLRCAFAIDAIDIFAPSLLTLSPNLIILYIFDMYSMNGGVCLNLIISNASGKPIYEQIYAQIRDCIVSGELSEGDALPSIRALAKDMRISVITTTRAYDELEKDGFINRVPGKGCYVARKNMELVREMHLKQIEQLLDEIITLAAPCGLTQSEICRMLQLLWDNREGKE